MLDRVRPSCADETDGYFDCRVGGALDPSGYVKGWAIERASDVLEPPARANHCVNGGGDVQCAGRPAPDAPGAVGIADPLRPGHIVATSSGQRPRRRHVGHGRTGCRTSSIRSPAAWSTPGRASALSARASAMWTRWRPRRPPPAPTRGAGSPCVTCRACSSTWCRRRHHRLSGASRTRTDRQVTHPSSFWNSPMSTRTRS